MSCAVLLSQILKNRRSTVAHSTYSLFAARQLAEFQLCRLLANSHEQTTVSMYHISGLDEYQIVGLFEKWAFVAPHPFFSSYCGNRVRTVCTSVRSRQHGIQHLEKHETWDTRITWAAPVRP